MSHHRTILTHCFLYASIHRSQVSTNDMLINRKIPLSVMWMCHTAGPKALKH